jgi:hypothetical protein
VDDNEVSTTIGTWRSVATSAAETEGIKVRCRRAAALPHFLVQLMLQGFQEGLNGYEDDATQRQAVSELSRAGKGSAVVGVRTELDSFRLEMPAL